MIVHNIVPVHLVGCVAGEDKGPRLVVPDAALILHLDTKICSFYWVVQYGQYILFRQIVSKIILYYLWIVCSCSCLP